MPGGRALRIGIVCVVVFVAAYVAVMTLYANTGLGRPRQVTEGRPATDGTTVTIDIEELQSVKGTLVGNVTVSPGPELLDPLTHGLKDDLSVAITSAVAPTKRTWSKDQVPGVFPVSLTISGDPSEWPFDHYRSGPITVELYRGAAQVPERAWVTFVDRIPGWLVSVPVGGNPSVPAPYRVELERSPSTATFAAVIVGVLIAIAGIALFVAVQTARGLRKFQPPMTTWYAAMLFAVVPLRNAMPDSPPIGFWVDVSVVLWVIVVLVASMGLYISCWWRDLRPEVDEPPKVDEPPEPVGAPPE
jgi:hypothetical protein